MIRIWCNLQFHRCSFFFSRLHMHKGSQCSRGSLPANHTHSTHLTTDNEKPYYYYFFFAGVKWNPAPLAPFSHRTLQSRRWTTAAPCWWRDCWEDWVLQAPLHNWKFNKMSGGDEEQETEVAFWHTRPGPHTCAHTHGPTTGSDMPPLCPSTDK